MRRKSALAYLLTRWMRNMRVVFSIDLTRTRSFAVIGEVASFMGLKFRTVFRILFAVLGRVRTRIERQFSVASTTNASLHSGENCQSRLPVPFQPPAYLPLSWSTPSMRSRRPKASASMVRGSSRAWFEGTLSREMSSRSPRFSSAG